MSTRRVLRLNSLLKEVISEVVTRELKTTKISSLVTVTGVEISPDLRYAKVSISVIGTAKEREATINALQAAAGFIAVTASKKVVMRYFPSLTFKLDSTVDEQMKIDSILKTIENERQARNNSETA